MLNFISIGRKIQEQRLKLNLNQQQLADTLYVSRQAVSKWELGESLPTIDNLVELIKIFNVTLEEILCLNDDLELDSNNIFLNHERHYIVRRAYNDDLGFNLSVVFNQFNKEERILILHNLKSNNIEIEDDLLKILTKIEKEYLEV